MIFSSWLRNDKCMRIKNLIVLLPLTVMFILMSTAMAEGSETAAVSVDMANGEEINELCAGCHGEFGQGGKEGEYPRIAGQPARYIERQMHLFRERKRPNIPMLEYVDERQFPDQEIRDIAAYISQIKLATRLPPIDRDNFDALERLELAKKMLNIPALKGDIKAGEALYKKECRACHGANGEGDADDAVPMLTGQYSDYLHRQVVKYRKMIRIHDPEDPSSDILKDMTDEELHNIYAYLSILDD